MFKRALLAFAAAMTFLPALAQAETAYRLTTMWRGEGMALDLASDGVTPMLAQTDPTDPYQYWSVEQPNGYHRLSPTYGKSLDVINDGTNNRVHLATTGNYSGQYWLLTPTGNGYYRLSTLWQGEGRSLDVVNDGGCNCKLQLADTGNYSGQYWRMELVEIPR